MKSINKTLNKYKLNEEVDSNVLDFVRDTNIFLAEASKTIKDVLTDGEFHRYWGILDSAFSELTIAYDHLLEARRQYSRALSILDRNKNERKRIGRN